VLANQYEKNKWKQKRAEQTRKTQEIVDGLDGKDRRFDADGASVNDSDDSRSGKDSIQMDSAEAKTAQGSVITNNRTAAGNESKFESAMDDEYF
jgi:hypothetical protein